MGHQHYFSEYILWYRGGVTKPLYSHINYHYMLGCFLQQKLDADDIPLVDRRGATMARDIVQFVPFNKIKGEGKSVVGIANLWLQMP